MWFDQSFLKKAFSKSSARILLDWDSLEQKALTLKAKLTQELLNVEKLWVNCTKKMFRELRFRHPPTHTQDWCLWEKNVSLVPRIAFSIADSLSGQKHIKYVHSLDRRKTGRLSSVGFPREKKENFFKSFITINPEWRWEDFDGRFWEFLFKRDLSFEIEKALQTPIVYLSSTTKTDADVFISSQNLK